MHFLHATMSIQMSMTLANKLHVRQKREIGISIKQAQHQMM